MKRRFFSLFDGFSVVVMIISALIGALLYWAQDSLNVKYIGLLLLLNAVTILISTIVYFFVDDSFYYVNAIIPASIVYVVIFIICGIVSYNIYSNRIENLVPCDIPVVEETRYVLWEGEEEEDEGRTKLIQVVKYNGSFNNSYFKFYYANENESGEVEILPFEIRENDVKIIVDSNGAEEVTEDYLLKTTTTYYGEYKNAKENEKVVISSEVEYKLYLREATFENMTIVTDSNK